jgi:hypothetical protein
MRLARLLVLLSACASQTPGYGVDKPGVVTCGCHEGDECYQQATDYAAAHGENDVSGEQLLYLTQCACFQESYAGCNILGHFAKDHVRGCEAGRNTKTTCTIAGFVYYHGAQLPRINGRSFDRDPVAARAAFTKGCAAGSQVACTYAAK